MLFFFWSYLRNLCLTQVSHFKKYFLLEVLLASLVSQTIKNLPAMQEIWVQPLGQKDPMEKEMTTHSSILAWEIPWTEEPGGLQSVEL